MKLCEMHCMFQQYDHATVKNAAAQSHPDKLAYANKVQKIRATMPAPQKAGIASIALYRKNGRNDMASVPRFRPRDIPNVRVNSAWHSPHQLSHARRWIDDYSHPRS